MCIIYKMLTKEQLKSDYGFILDNKPVYNCVFYDKWNEMKEYDFVIDHIHKVYTLIESTNRDFVCEGDYTTYKVTCFACRSCVNCIDCVYCADCTNCKDCIDCKYCTDCKECIECTYCNNCEKCVNCSESCRDCNGCVQCTCCIKCTDCYKCEHTCKGCVKCIQCDSCDNCEKCFNCLLCKNVHDKHERMIDIRNVIKVNKILYEKLREY